MTNLQLLRRVETLKAMRTVLRNMNNEDGYIEFATFMADDFSDESYIYIANNDDFMTEMEEIFLESVKELGDDGFYYGL